MKFSYTNPSLINNAQTPRAKVNTQTGSRTTPGSTFTQPYVSGQSLSNTVDAVGKLANNVADDLAIKKAKEVGAKEQTLVGSDKLLGEGESPITTFGKARQAARNLAYQNSKEFDLNQIFEDLKDKNELTYDVEKFNKISEDRKAKFLIGVPQEQLPIWEDMFNRNQELFRDSIENNVDNRILLKGAQDNIANMNSELLKFQQISLLSSANTGNIDEDQDTISAIGTQLAITFNKLEELKFNPTIDANSYATLEKKAIETAALQLLKKDYLEGDADRKAQIEAEINNKTYKFGKFENVMSKILPNGKLTKEIFDQIDAGFVDLNKEAIGILKNSRKDLEKSFVEITNSYLEGKHLRNTIMVDANAVAGELSNVVGLTGDMQNKDGVEPNANLIQSEFSWSTFENEFRELQYTEQQIAQKRLDWDLAIEIGQSSRIGYSTGIGTERSQNERKKLIQIIEKIKNKEPFEKGNPLLGYLDEKSSNALYEDEDQYKHFLLTAQKKLTAFEMSKNVIREHISKNTTATLLDTLIEQQIIRPPKALDQTSMENYVQEVSNLLGVSLPLTTILPKSTLVDPLSNSLSQATNGSQILQVLSQYENNSGQLITSQALQANALDKNDTTNYAYLAMYSIYTPNNASNTQDFGGAILAFADNQERLLSKMPFKDANATSDAQFKALENAVNEEFAKGGSFENIDLASSAGKSLKAAYTVVLTARIANAKGESVSDSEEYARNWVAQNYHVVDITGTGNTSVISKKFLPTEKNIQDYKDHLEAFKKDPLSFGIIPANGMTVEDIRDRWDDFNYSFEGNTVTITDASGQSIGYSIIPSADTGVAIFGKMFVTPTGYRQVNVMAEDRAMSPSEDITFSFDKWESNFVPKKDPTSKRIYLKNEKNLKNTYEKYTELGQDFIYGTTTHDAMYVGLDGKFYDTQENAGSGSSIVYVNKKTGQDDTAAFKKRSELINKYRTLDALGLSSDDKNTMVALMFKAESQDLTAQDLEYMADINPEFAPLKNKATRQVVLRNFNKDRTLVFQGIPFYGDTGALMDMSTLLINKINSVTDREVYNQQISLTPNIADDGI